MGREDSRRRRRRAAPDGLRQKQKSVRTARRGQSRVVGKWQGKGWELVDRAEGRFRTRLTFRRKVAVIRWGWLSAAGWLRVLLACALVAATAVVLVDNGPQWRARYEAWAAVRSLDSGDLGAVEERLASNRGNPDFAYFFTSRATPRALGDALATVAGKSKDEPLKPSVDPHKYELTLTDLAGTLALATHGTGDRSLDESWTTDFITATTNPSDLYKVDGSIGDKIPLHKTDAEKRRDQDAANRSNLLLLLARGYWSTEFLQSLTKKYYDFDRKEGDDAWPDADPDDNVGFAPAPNGVYLTDGVLALTAALTANSAASEWAFTEFQPGTVEIDGSDHEIGEFTHFLLFEHRFPDGSDDGSIGMTAALTALSSAIDSTSSSEAALEEASSGASAEDADPMRDSETLQALARDMVKGTGCSPNPLDFGHCVIAAAKLVWRRVQRWGHLVLDILTFATSFAPPPFNLISLAPATVNATWYAIEDDYLMAGLSLAAVLPGLGFGKIATRATAAKDAATATKAAKAAAGSDKVAKAARRWRPLKLWKDCDLVPQGGLRLKYHPAWTAAQRKAADEKVKEIWKAGQRGDLRKTLPQRSNTLASSRYQKAGGSVPDGHDVDHTIDLQLGGSDDLSNMKPLDIAVNRSIGKQIDAQLGDLDYGAPILGAAIC